MNANFQIIKRPQSVAPRSSVPNIPSEPNPESNLGYGIRTGLRTAASGLSAAAALPGSAAGLAFGLGNAVAPNHIPTYKQVREKWPSLPQEYPEIRQAFNDWTGGYLAPRTEGEQKADDIVAEIASLGRGGNPKTYTQLLGKFAQAAGIVGAGEAAKKGVGYAGLGGLGQSLAKHGTQLALGLYGTHRGIRNNMEKNFEVANGIGEGQIFNADKLEGILSKVQDEIAESAGPAREWGLKRLAEIAPALSQQGTLLDKTGNLITKKEADVGKIMGLIKNINAWYKSRDFPAEGSTIAKKISDPLREFVDEYSNSPSAPEDFKEAWNQSREVYSALKNNWQITKNLNKYLSTDQLSSPVGKLIRNTLSFNWGMAPKALLLGGGALVAREGVKLFDFLSKSGVARDAYAEFLENMAIGNVHAIKRDFGLLEKEAKKHGIKEPSGFKITKRPKSEKVEIPEEMPLT